MKTRGAITLVFDDGYKAVYEEVLPLLASYNVHAVFAVSLGARKIAGEDVAASSDWLAIAKRYGHEIAAHGIDHTDLTTLSDTELDTELTQPAEELGATTIVYPGGAHDQRIVAKAKEIYTAGRTVIRGLETLPPKDPMRLATVNFTKRNFSPVRANVHALRAFVQNRWLIETYHMVRSRPSSLMHSALLDDLDAHLDFITSLPIKITTIQDILH